MWIAEVGQLPVDIVLTIPPHNSSVSKIKVWNYNKTLKDSAKGVQDCEVWISGELWWRGVVERGCGNQVFDYATTIPLVYPQQSQPSLQQLKPTKKPHSSKTMPQSSIQRPTIPEEKPPILRSGSNTKLGDPEARNSIGKIGELEIKPMHSRGSSKSHPPKLQLSSMQSGTESR